MGPLPGNGYSALPRICTLSKRWLAMEVCSASDILTFRQHAPRYIYSFIYLFTYSNATFYCQSKVSYYEIMSMVCNGL
jgi:hypothetical protein